MNITAIKTNRDNSQYSREKNDKQNINKTLQGVLVNSHLRNSQCCEKYSFDDMQNALLINKSDKYYSIETKKENQKLNDSVFDVKKAITPLLAGVAMIFGTCFALTAVLKKSSKSLLKTKSYEHLPDLAINMNIREEPQFAIYRAIRDPNYRNIFAASCVFVMSGITIACKNFVDGAKEVWVKKRSADIEKNLQENLISVDRDAFSGKLKVVNDMMNENVEYFENVINTTPGTKCPDFSSFQKEKHKTQNVFSHFSSAFKGENKTTKDNEKKTDNYKYMALTTGVILSGVLFGKKSLSNINAAMKNSEQFANDFTENAINAIENISEKKNKNDLSGIIELLKSICAKPDFIKDIGKKYNLSEKEIQNIINSVEESKKTIFADAPTALGGVPKKVQYYCYIDEPRGHLYNWILNPDNKFTKYIFTAFTASSGIGYTFEQAMNAVKETAVMSENAKTDLDLKKQLVAVEIESFKAKKESAINPLVDNFTKMANDEKKSKKELKQIADNILMEIKNGPPYVYN